MMDFGGLDVGINCKYTPLYDDPDEPLFTLIEQGGQATRNTLVDNIFTDSFEDDTFGMPLYERKLLMTMQMASSASSMGFAQGGRPGSLTSFDTLSSKNFIDDTHDLVRERNPSTSSFAGLCIHPDLMMNTSLNSSTDEFLADSLPVIEDLQDQIFLEDGHQNLQPDDLLIPLDEAIDGKALQEQLINQITGNNQSLLAVDACEGNPSPNLVDPSPTKNEVKKVETTPGSQNVCIDGTDVELPAGSVVLAVMNENGALVTLPSPANPCADDLTKLSSSPEIERTSSSSLFSCVTLSTGNSNPPSISSMNDTPMPLELQRVSETGGSNLRLSVNKEITDGYSKEMKLQLIDACGDAYPNISTIGVPQNEVSVSSNQSDTEDAFVDVETVSDTTPVIEAVDLDTLLAEFEATESANIQLEKKPQPMLDLDEGDFLGFETPAKDPSPALKARSLLIKKEVRECEDSEQRASPESSSSSLSPETVEGRPAKQAKKLELENKAKLHKRMTHQKIKNSLPVEIIEKIKASSKRSRTKILPEPLVPVPKAKKSHSKSKLLKKNCQDLKKENKLVLCAQKKTSLVGDDEIKDGRESPIPTPIDHTYCSTPQKKSLEKDSPHSCPKIFNKLPDYVQDPSREDKVKTPPKSEVVPKSESDCEPKTCGSSLQMELKPEEKENEALISEQSIPSPVEKIVKKEIETEGPLYSRLPDYVTDIGNVKPKVELVEEESDRKTEAVCQDVSESSLDNTLQGEAQVKAKEEQPKKKKKLKLDEYRMRMISSANNSRSNSPLVGEDPSGKKGCKNQGIEESMVIKGEATTNLTSVQALSNDIVEEREEGEIKEDADEGNAANIPQDAIKPLLVKSVATPKKHTHPETKVATHRDRESKTSVDGQAMITTHGEKKEQNARSAKPSKMTRKPPTVIEIDLVEEEDKEKERQQKGQTKLGLIDSLPLSKMPTTSLGHSLLYSRKNGDNPDKKITKYDYSKVSSHHRFSSSRSRSPSWSSKRSSRSYKSKESSRYTSHRKSRRRWSRSRSRGRSRSRSYSASSTSSLVSLSSRSRSRSRSTSYSKSYYSRSRSRSRSNRRWDRSRSRKSKRYSRSKERSRDRSRRRSWSKSPQEWGNSWKRGRSPNWGYHSRPNYTYGSRYPPAPPSARYSSRHRNSEHVDSDGDERRIIYVGSIDEGTTRADLRRKFGKFGPIVDIKIHFRDNGDNYGFVTFRYQQHAYDAMEHGNDDPNLPEYSLCFGQRRTFCKVEYSDLDAQNEDYEYHVTPATMDYDTLLKSTLHMRR